MAKKKKTAASKKKASKKVPVKASRKAPRRAKPAKSKATKAKSKKKSTATGRTNSIRKKVTKKTVSKKTVAKKVVTKKKPPVSAKTKAAKSKKNTVPVEPYVAPKIPKTRLSAKQLAMFRRMLLDKRKELMGDVRMLTRDALGRSRQESSGDLSNVPIHMADIGSDNWEQDFTIGLIANERELVRQIDDALSRIENKTYGVCLETFKPITVARLRAKPWAKYSIEYARQRETGRG